MENVGSLSRVFTVLTFGPKLVREKDVGWTPDSGRNAGGLLITLTSYIIIFSANFVKRLRI